MSKPEARKIWLVAEFLACAVCLVSANQVFGQATTGTISGTVQDVQRGMVPGATVNVCTDSRSMRFTNFRFIEVRQAPRPLAGRLADRGVSHVAERHPLRAA